MDDAFRCRFVATPQPNVWRCAACGFVARSHHPPHRIWRRCDALHLGTADPRQGMCRFLGPMAGLADCTTCRGRVQVKQYRCTHPAHDLTTLAACRVCPDYAPPALASGGARRALLLRFPHGLGDAVQLTVVLQHLRAAYPQWDVDVAVRRGAQSLYAGLCRRAYVLGEEPAAGYDAVRYLAWHEPQTCYADSPSTKAQRALRDIFHIEPRLTESGYHVQPDPQAEQLAASFVAGLGAAAVLLHYRGHSSRRNKDLDHRTAVELCRHLLRRGLRPVLLDWDEGGGAGFPCGVVHPDGLHPLWRQQRTGDGAVLVALARQAALSIGIDSGPGHAFGASGAPTLIVWRGHHPLHFYDLAPSVLHLVRDDHRRLLRGDAEAGLPFFQQHYRHRLYRDLEHALPRVVDELLGWAPPDAAPRRPALSDTAPPDTAPPDMAPPDTAPPDAAPPACPAHPQDAGRYAGGSARHDGHVSPLRSAPRRSTRQPACAPRPPRVFRIARAEHAPGLIHDADHWLRGQHHAADLTIVRDVYLDDCYAVGQLPIVPRYVLDIGAHIGAFARRLHQRFARAQLACVEANVANIACLRANVGDFARVIHAACTYERNVGLLCTVFPGSGNTGGSTVAVVDGPRWAAADPQYRRRREPLATCTLESLLAELGWPRIDLLKLDCEGSEFSILADATCLDRVRMIVGEQHDPGRFAALRARRFAHWQLRVLRRGSPGLFWLVNPRPHPPAASH
jgi:FkbM family methyltransferase